MTNAATTSTRETMHGIARMMKVADHAPMVITRLSGWIHVGEVKTAPSWIIPTRSRTHR